MKEVVTSIVVAVLSYFVAMNWGTWCGTATFLILLLVHRKSHD